MKTSSELVDELRSPRYAPVMALELIGRSGACHPEATSTSAKDDLKCFWEHVLLARSSNCSTLVSEAEIQVRRKPHCSIACRQQA